MIRGRRAPTTTAAGVLAILVSIPYLLQGVAALAVALGADLDLGGQPVLLRLGVPATAGDATAVTVPGAIATLFVTALALAVAVGVLRRRELAREGGIGLFALLAAVLVLLSIQGLATSPRGPNAVWGLVAGIANIAVVALLLLPATVADIDRAESARDQSR